MQGNLPVEYKKTLCECANIEADEEYDLDEIKVCIKRRNSFLYRITCLGFPKKTDWTLEPYKNFSAGAQTKLLQFHINHPNAPRNDRVTLEPEEQYLSCFIPR